ncbi:unnamed protein product [Rhizopus stolonifer]
MSLELSIHEILLKYANNPPLLHHVLKAKSEEDRKETAQLVLKTEQAKLHLRQLDLQWIREVQLSPTRRGSWVSSDDRNHSPPPILPPIDDSRINM